MTLITSATDLAAAVRDLRPDAVAALSMPITADWCRDRMHDLGIDRYEDVDEEALGAIADAVDNLGSEGSGRYCGPCDKWVPKRQTVCRACGADTDRA